VVRRFPQEPSLFTLELILLFHFERRYLNYNVKDSGLVGPWSLSSRKVVFVTLFCTACLFVCVTLTSYCQLSTFIWDTQYK